MTKSSKKALVLLLAMSMLFTVLFAGCGKTEDTPGTTTQTPATSGSSDEETTADVPQEPEEPYEFSIFRTAWTDLDDENDPVIQEINKKFNVKIKILTAPYETWTEKYNIYVTSGDIPDLSVTTGPGTANFNDWAKQKIYMDILDLYKQHCPNTQKYLSDDIINAHLMDGGKLYGIPKPSLTDSAFAIRKDWLDKLELPMPETLDQLYDVLKAFKEKDPDGNNKTDTYLFSEDSLNTINFVFRSFGCSTPPPMGNDLPWIPEGDGKLTSPLLAPGMKDAIIYVKKLFDDGILDPEWMLTKSQAYNDKIFTGKAGFVSASFQEMISFTESKIKANDPSIELAILDGVKGPGGNVRPMQKGFYMVSSISAKVEKPEKILEFVDFLMSEEGDTMIRYGLEGLTYSKVDGKIVRDEEAAKKYAMEAGHRFRQIMQPTTINVLPADDPRAPKLAEMAQILYDGPFYPAPTLSPPSLKEVATQQGAEYVKNEITLIITGGGDASAKWDEFIKKWKETGGDKLIQEINELYEANQK